MTLTRVDLPAPLSPIRPEHFAGLERHVDFVQRMDRAKMLRHRVQFKNRQTGFLRALRLFFVAHATLVG